MSDIEISTYHVKDSVSDLRGGRRILTPKQKTFLVALAEGGDEQEAAKVAGYKSVHEALESEYVLAEVERIQKAWAYEVRMNAKFASGEHMRLMEKFEDDYNIAKKDDKPKMASVLAKMSDTTLRASGKMGGGEGVGGATVNVQINIGGSVPVSQESDIIIEQGG